jgi:RNA polymerase sigma-B factor
VLEALEAGQAYRFASLDAPAPGPDDDSSATLASQIGEDDVTMAAAEDRAALSPLLEHLPPREQKIIFLRFFQGMTQSEIATQLGISQMHVSRLLARSLAQLRSVVTEP